VAKLNTIEALQERVREIERVLIAKGHIRATTRQGAAIHFLCENLEALREIIEQHRATQLPKAT
jgi:hypothetical protein